MTTSTVNSNHFSICSGLAAIFNGKFQAISGLISESVRVKTKVRLLFVTKRKWHTPLEMR